MYVYMYNGGLKSSYDDVISPVENFFWRMGSKHCNTTTGRSMWTTRGTILKNKTSFDHIP